MTARTNAEIARLTGIVADLSVQRDFYRMTLQQLRHRLRALDQAAKHANTAIRAFLKDSTPEAAQRLNAALDELHGAMEDTPQNAAFVELWAAASDAVKDTRLLTNERFERLRRAVRALPHMVTP